MLDTNETTALLAATTGAGVLVLLSKGRAPLRGTTLLAPWAWAVFSTLAVAGNELAAALSSDGARWIAPLRTIAAMSTFCPVMAVLGAKRPQDRAWQFIVFSLWIVLCLPAIKGWLFDAGEPQEIHPARAWFLLILIVVGLINYLPTRYSLASLLFLGAQVAVLSAYLPFGVRGLPGPAGALLCLALSLAAALSVTFARSARRRAADPMNRVWLDFRDRFGTLWALRVAERVNVSARMYGWPVHLGWGGFQASSPQHRDDSAPPATAAFDRTILLGMRNLLRRFVSDAWLAERIGRELIAESPSDVSASAARR